MTAPVPAFVESSLTDLRLNLMEHDPVPSARGTVLVKLTDSRGNVWAGEARLSLQLVSSPPPPSTKAREVIPGPVGRLCGYKGHCMATACRTVCALSMEESRGMRT